MEIHSSKNNVLGLIILIAVGPTLGLLPTGEAAAQIRPAMVRSVDEPARVPYYHSVAPACPFINLCQVTFPVVPAGKRLRVTSITGVFIGLGANGFVALNLNARGNPRQSYPFSPFNGAFYGNVVSFNHEVDVFFETGESPHLEVGILASAGSIPLDARNRLAVSGYLVDVLP